jgi:branched-chain amino acid transport system permease protein
VTRTKIGTAMRACSMDQETAALMGISVDRVIAFTFVIGSAMAAVAGVLSAVKVGGNISFRMGYYPGLLAFAAAVLGGIGNIRGAMLGGVLIGFVQGFTGGTFSAPFLVMILVLLVMPRGILGEPQATRA